MSAGGIHHGGSTTMKANWSTQVSELARGAGRWLERASRHIERAALALAAKGERLRPDRANADTGSGKRGRGAVDLAILRALAGGGLPGELTAKSQKQTPGPGQAPAENR